MKPFTLIACIACLLLCSCRQSETRSENQNAPAADPASATELSDTVITDTGVSDDRQQLQKLVRQLYKWHQTQSSQNDFEPVAGKGDSAYVGLDLSRHQARSWKTTTGSGWPLTRDSKAESSSGRWAICLLSATMPTRGATARTTRKTTGKR